MTISVDGFENINDNLQFAPRGAVETIHRIEHDVDVEQSIENFWRLYDRENFFVEYVAQFIRMTTVHRERFFRRLIERSERAEAIELASATAEIEFDD